MKFFFFIIVIIPFCCSEGAHRLSDVYCADSQCSASPDPDIWPLISANYTVNCSKPLRMGQYKCLPPAIDPDTQQPYTCTPLNVATTNCTLAPGLFCAEGTGVNETTFRMSIPCNWTNGYSFETALLLSIFLGMFGADRFYLGYPALGALKFCTLGFMFLGQLIDIVLISMQIVRPADGSYYVIKYHGPRLTILHADNDSYLVPRDDW